MQATNENFEYMTAKADTISKELQKNDFNPDEENTWYGSLLT